MWSVTSSLGLLLLILISVAFFSLFERKIMAGVQSRLGPNKVFVGGLFQPIADAMKLLSKEESIPNNSKEILYFLSPIFVIITPIFVWLIYPVEFGFFQSESSMLLLSVYFSISVYGLVLSGWSSNSRYATLGCVRAISQSISYEIGLTTVIVFLLIFTSTMSIEGVISSQEVFFFTVLPPLFVVGSICLFAEVSRTPFDLSEGESELVSGYSVEYGGGKYTIIFLGENLALLWASCVISLCFFKGNLMLFFVFVFVWARCTFPRMRFDKVMTLFWILLLPLILGGGGILLSTFAFNQSQHGTLLLAGSTGLNNILVKKLR